jgi:ribonucleotide monophosphatase NagD (HAD superfamily)
MNLLKASKIPYVFVTNGGGITELEKSKELTKKIGIDKVTDFLHTKKIS